MSRARRVRTDARPPRRTASLLALAITVAGCSATPGSAPPGATTSFAAPAASSSPRTSPTGPDGEADSHHADPPDRGALTVPEAGSGDTSDVAVPGSDTPAAEAPGRTVSYSIEIEGGLEKVATGFPEFVRATLTDARGWQKSDGVRFVDVTPKERDGGTKPDVRILFASPRLVDRECAPLRTNGRLSCNSGNRVMINAWRWVNGATTYGEDIQGYRTYLVNHEVGHALGHGHVPCPGRGRPAPVMLQQTLRLEGCRTNPYPVLPR